MIRVIRLCIFIVVVPVAACGQQRGPKPGTSTGLQVAADAAIVADAVVPVPVDGDNGVARGCIIKPPDMLVVLDIEPVQVGPTVGMMAARVTDELRTKASAAGVPLSPYRRYGFLEQWDAACTAKPNGDGVCMGLVATRLRTDWVIWGDVSRRRDDKHFTVTLQLVPADNPTNERHVIFELSSETELESAIHDAWSRLVAESGPEP